MKKYYALFACIILLVLIISSCSERYSEHWSKITEVESYIEEHPDSALTVLQNIPAEDLHNTEERAKYALLLSMALDKNVIDTTNFNVLQPAIDYYSRKGSATDKLRMYYYKGRIHENAGDDNLAMESMVIALSEGEESKDILTKARALAIQGKIYNSLYEWGKSKEVYLEAAKYFKEANRINSYVNNILSIINTCVQDNNPKEAELYIEKIKPIIHKCSEKTKSYFFSNWITYIVKYGNATQMESVIDNYLNSVKPSSVQWLSLAYAYLEMNNLEGAKNAFSQFERYNDISPDGKNMTRYHALLSDFYKKSGEYEKSNEAYEQYVRLKGTSNYKQKIQGTQFVEERYDLQLQKSKALTAKYKILFYSSLLVIVLLLVILFIQHKLRIKIQEKEKLEQLYNDLEQERDNLTNLLKENKELDNSTQSILHERIALLNKYITSYITDNAEIMRNADKELTNMLADKDAFLNSTRMAFTNSHPNFIKHLEECDLTKWEINYCCLYALGLKGKEVGNYIGLKSNYNQSSRIREKLGLNENNTNLGIYIKQLLNTSC